METASWGAMVAALDSKLETAEKEATMNWRRQQHEQATQRQRQKCYAVLVVALATADKIIFVS